MPEKPSLNLVSCMEASAPASPKRVENAPAAWTHWVLPSIADVFFLVLLCILVLSPASSGLLGDADTGWHIRNGEQILATHSVPRVDSFSYTKGGEAWYAWEWLYDAGIGAIHKLSGLNGVVLFTGIVIAGTFALLFRFVLRRSGNFVVAASLTLLAAAAAQVHMLARPHVLTWLFTLLWVEILYRFNEGGRRILLWLPLLMLLWVNVHGGFILGLVLLGVCGVAQVWNHLTAPRDDDFERGSFLALVFSVCLAVTLLTPYGYKLHVHVYEYLSNGFLMNSINEFMSPNFHASGFGYFEMLILLVILGSVLGSDGITAFDLLLLLFSIHAGLYAARNIPISALLISLALGRPLSSVFSPQYCRMVQARWLSALRESVHAFSMDMMAMEERFRGHGIALIALVLCAATVLNGGRIFSVQVVDAHFSEQTFPVKAAEFIAQKGIRDHIFNPDDWSGYLIYRLYPGTKLYFDDRHDFYGEAFIKEYLKAAHSSWQWREPLEKYEVKWVLIPSDSPLASVLKESGKWSVEYDDRLAIVFYRCR